MDEMKDPITLDFTATQTPAEDAPVGQKALDSERPPVRVVLLALDQGKFDAQRSLDELAALAEANGMQAVATVCQKRSTPEAATLLGEGKVEEARLVCLNTDAEAAIFDGELTGSQIRNLSAALQVEVLDRTMLILEIFRARATTNEGKLQTELATLKYRMPRLQGLGEALSRQGGGGGGGGGARRGAGETKLELDRRYLRSRIEKLESRLKELRATGLTWDEGPDIGGPVGPYVQSQRMGMFKQYAEQLVKAGKAYYCFCTEERLNDLHEQQKANGEMSHYDGHCRDLPQEEINAKLAAGVPYVIRQKIPAEGVTGFDDVVYGHIEVNNSELDDQILIKTDGMPTYNFANVVDDHLMGITHVIRGSEYLSSTPKYNLLYQAFGWEVPTYIHCPPVMKDAQHKLSKRNGDASYQDLVAKGYLPAAVLNYLLLLGWAPEGEQEIFSLDEMIKIWDPARISKSPAIFDPLKLRAINAAYIRALPAEEFRKLADPFIDQAVHVQIDRDLLCANLQPRCEVLEDIPPQLDFFDAVLPIDAEMYRNKKQKTTPESAKEALAALLPVLEAQADWSRDAIFEACKTLAEQMEIALSGKARTPERPLAGRNHRPRKGRAGKAMPVARSTGIYGQYRIILSADTASAAAPQIIPGILPSNICSA